MSSFTAYIEWDPETKLYVGIIPGIPGAHTEGATLDELRENLKEVLELCLEENPDLKESLPHCPTPLGVQDSVKNKVIYIREDKV